MQDQSLNNAAHLAQSAVALLQQARTHLMGIGIISDEAVEACRAVDEALLDCFRLRLQAQLMQFDAYEEPSASTGTYDGFKG
jgi:phosphoheptose isomerase